MSSHRHDRYVRIAWLAARRDTASLCTALAGLGEDADRAIEILGRHTLIGLVLGALPESCEAALPDALAARLRAWRHRRWLPAAAFVDALREASATLGAHGVPVLSLKGLYFADRLYGGIDRRPMHDLDLLVERRHFRRAVRALAASGFEADAYDAHSRTLKRGEIKIDLHRCLRRAPAFRIDEAAFWQSSIEAAAGPLRIRTLSDEWTLVFLLLASFEDIGQGTIKLRQLLDLALLIDSIDERFDWEGFFERRRPESLLALSVNVLAVLIAVFDADARWPRLIRSLQRYRGLVIEPGHDAALDLVFAPRKHAANLAFFGRVYPGNLGLYLAWFWYGGFPDNLSQFSWARTRAGLRLACGLGLQAPVDRARARS